jgi:hypothetical protein
LSWWIVEADDAAFDLEPVGQVNRYGPDRLCYMCSKASEHQSEPRFPILIKVHLKSSCSNLCRKEGAD